MPGTILQQKKGDEKSSLRRLLLLYMREEIAKQLVSTEKNKYLVSTVNIGIYYETMIFKVTPKGINADRPMYEKRYHKLKLAKRGHKKAVEIAKAEAFRTAVVPIIPLTAS